MPLWKPCAVVLQCYLLGCHSLFSHPVQCLHCTVLWAEYFIEASEYFMQLYHHPETTQSWSMPSGRVKLWCVPWGRACTLLLLLTQTGSGQISRRLRSPPPCVSTARCSNSYWQHHLPACLSFPRSALARDRLQTLSQAL